MGPGVLAVLREAKAYDREAVAKPQAGRTTLPENAFAQERTREKDEAKKAREREPSSPTGDTPPAKILRRRAPCSLERPSAKSKRTGPLMPG